MSRKIRTFTPLDADTWDALVASAEPDAGSWCVEMSNGDLGAILGINRRLASARAKRLIDFGMVRPVYSEKNGRPQSKVYYIINDWLGRSPSVGGYYPVNGGEAV